MVRGKKVVPLDVKGPLVVNQFGPMLAACLAGQGIAQLLDFHVKDLMSDGKLVHLFPDWADETYPLYAYHHFAQHLSAKVRVFLDYVGLHHAPRRQSRVALTDPGMGGALRGTRWHGRAEFVRFR
jgi:DNA-binding transcriptional LysR family regulator